MSKLLTLEDWAKSQYVKPPTLRTLRRWARDAKIVPTPKKQGRAYYVQEDARFRDWNVDESQETQLG
jgi:predicted site-specific integrase-resolvase